MDFEYRIWAERLIHDVSEETKQEEHTVANFVKAWRGWIELLRFVNTIEVMMYKRDVVSHTDLSWHQTIVSGLIALAGLLKDSAKNLDQNILKTIGFDEKEITTGIAGLTESFQEWHGETSSSRVEFIVGLIDDSSK